MTYEEKRELKVIAYTNLVVFTIQMLVIAITTYEPNHTSSVFLFYLEDTPISLERYVCFSIWGFVFLF